jgi:hypothetical protein
MDIVVGGVLLLFAAGTIAIFVRGSFSKNRGSSPGALTAFHDFGTADKRRAMEMVIEQKAGKKMEEQESGEGATPGRPPARKSVRRRRRGGRKRGTS